MKEIVSLEGRTLAIIHFAEEEGRPMTRQVHYQAVLDPQKLSPSGEFIRADHGRYSEINGWIAVQSIVIDEILDEGFTLEKETEQLEAA